MASKSLDELIAGHVARNAELSKTLAGYGIDLNKPRACDLNFDCADESGARDLAVELQPLGIATQVNEPFEIGFTKVGWVVVGKADLSPQAIMDSEFTRRLAELSIKHRANYDGWGTALVELASPANPE